MHSVLVICTGNAARSILAEAIFHRDAADRVHAYSAGTNPAGRINPATARQLALRGLAVNGYRSKGWQEFAADGAPKIDLVIALSEGAEEELAQVLPGNPVWVTWPIEDPATAPPDQIDLAFQSAFHRLTARINTLLALPFETMRAEQLTDELERIGRG